MLYFKCEKCGACCQIITGITDLEEYDLGNGRCRMLGTDNLCTIYGSRPGVCKQDYVYKHFFPYIDSELFVKQMKRICLRLREERIKGACDERL
ncbi:YkgJ family cysteine cluster protein [Sporomusa sp.]|uniref:YkgJ family cysteine cluster protein n=1 Tax=Sporomusa sp. TaxID=2078658 RepID=UPI0039C9C8B7